MNNRLEGEVGAASFLGMSLILASAGWGAAQNPKLVLRVDDWTGITRSDLAGAVGETERIFRWAGIDLIRTEGDPGTPPTAPTVVVANIVSTAGPEYPVEVLGRALPSGVSGARITLFLENIRARAAKAALPLPILLGHALAHELGHVMLGAGSGDHRFPGLMCGQWGSMEFERIRHGALKFSQSQAAALRRTIDRLHGDARVIAGSGSPGELRTGTGREDLLSKERRRSR